MAAVTLTKIDGKPTGPLGVKVVAESDPTWSWYTAGAINDGDTSAFTGWNQMLPRRVRVVPIATSEACTPAFALSGGTLTITYQTTLGNVSAGAFVGVQL